MADFSLIKDGLALLKSYAEFMLVAELATLLLLLISLPVLFAESIFTFWGKGFPREIRGPLLPSGGFLLLLIVIVLLILGLAVLVFIAVYFKLVPAAERLSRFNQAFTTSSKFVKYGYWGGLALGLLGLAVFALIFFPMIFSNSAMFSLERVIAGVLALDLFLAFAALLGFIGWVGELMLLYELGRATGIEEFKSVVVLFVAAAALGLLVLVGNPWVFMSFVLVSTILSIMGFYVLRSASIKALQQRVA